MSVSIRHISSIIFSADYPEIRITCNQVANIDFTLTVNSSVILSETYAVDTTGIVNVRGLEELINETMEASDTRIAQVIIHAKNSSNPSDTDTVSSTAVYSRYHIIGSSASAFLSSHFLRRGEVSQTTREATETLRYYCDEDYTETMMITATSDNGEVETTTVETEREEGLVEIDASYSEILELFPDFDSIVSYRISIDDKAAYYYVIDAPMYEFLFRNMFGYIEVCRLQGVFTKNFSTEKSFATSAGRTIQYDVRHEMTMTIDTSPMNLLDVEIFMDMATSDAISYLGEPALIVEYECNPNNKPGQTNRATVEFQFVNKKLAAYLGESGRVFTEEFTKQYY